MNTDLAQRLNEIEGNLRRLDEQVRAGRLVREVVGGGGQSLIAFAKVVSVDDDHLVCNFYDEAAGTVGAQVLVAKPWVVRKTPFHNQTITFKDGSIITYAYITQRRRTATKLGVPETQKVSPDYADDEKILIARIHTGLGTVESPIVWQEISGREWAREPA